MSRGEVTEKYIVSRSTVNQLADSPEDRFLAEFRLNLRTEIENIVRQNRKVTYKLIAHRLQLYTPGITPIELYDSFRTDISNFLEEYDQ